MNIFKLLFKVFFLLFFICFSSCRKYDNYPSTFIIINDFSGEGLFLGHEDEDTYRIGESPVIGYLFGGRDDDTTSITFDWDDDGFEALNPRFNNLRVFRYTSRNGFYYATGVRSAPFKVRPGRVYQIDAETMEVIDTGERNERHPREGLFGGSGCGALKGTHRLVRVNGKSLPYTEAGSPVRVNSGSIVLTADTWESEINTYDTNSEQTTIVERNGTYDCDDGSGTMIGSGGTSTYTFEEGTLTIYDGNYTMEYK